MCPFLHNDGDAFPEEAKQIQCKDFSSCRSVMPAFVQHESAVVFERLVEEFAEPVAQVIEHAPDFQPDWPVVDAKPELPPRVATPRL